jgi:8-oxo-dGTP diphosphatase
VAQFGDPPFVYPLKEETRVPRIGVGVVVLNDQRQILLGRRIKKFGYGFWSFPGGHLEFYESAIDCARREVKEETNLDVSFFTKGPYTEDFIEEDKHYITLYVMAHLLPDSAPLENREPHTHSDWGWFNLNKLPDPVWRPVEKLLTSVQLGLDFAQHDLRAII